MGALRVSAPRIKKSDFAGGTIRNVAPPFMTLDVPKAVLVEPGCSARFQRARKYNSLMHAERSDAWGVHEPPAVPLLRNCDVPVLTGRQNRDIAHLRDPKWGRFAYLLRPFGPFAYWNVIDVRAKSALGIQE